VEGKREKEGLYFLSSENEGKDLKFNLFERRKRRNRGLTQRTEGLP